MVGPLYILAAWMLQSSCPSAPGGFAHIPPETRPVHRFWSPAYGRHFYTLDEAEKNGLAAHQAHVWTYEGAAFRAFPSPGDSHLAPVHRFWCGLLHTHFYTIDEREANRLILEYSHVWTYEGVGFWAYPAGSPQHDWLLCEFASPAYRDATWRMVILHELP